MGLHKTFRLIDFSGRTHWHNIQAKCTTVRPLLIHYMLIFSFMNHISDYYSVAPKATEFYLAITPRYIWHYWSHAYRFWHWQLKVNTFSHRRLCSFGPFMYYLQNLSLWLVCPRRSTSLSMFMTFNRWWMNTNYLFIICIYTAG